VRAPTLVAHGRARGLDGNPACFGLAEPMASLGTKHRPGTPHAVSRQTPMVIPARVSGPSRRFAPEGAQPRVKRGRLPQARAVRAQAWADRLNGVGVGTCEHALGEDARSAGAHERLAGQTQPAPALRELGHLKSRQRTVCEPWGRPPDSRGGASSYRSRNGTMAPPQAESVGRPHAFAQTAPSLGFRGARWLSSSGRAALVGRSLVRDGATAPVSSLAHGLGEAKR
jgi:hypothetical protein